MSTPHPRSVSLDSLPVGREMGKIRIQATDFDGRRAMLVTVQPGGSWSNDLKAAAGTESCQNTHLGYILSGKMGVRMDDGHEEYMSPKDLFFVPKGHDAWCVGEEPAVFLEFAVDSA